MHTSAAPRSRSHARPERARKGLVGKPMATAGDVGVRLLRRSASSTLDAGDCPAVPLPSAGAGAFVARPPASDCCHR